MSEVKKEPILAGAEVEGKKVREVIPLKGMRKVMAEHILRSIQTSAQMTQFTMVEMTEMIKFRQNLLSQEKTTGMHFTYTDLFVKAIAKVLTQVRMYNSTITDNEIIIWDDINIGVALAYQLREGGHGLIVPVVHNADKKSLAEIHQAVTDLRDRGRSNKLRPNDVSGGTFTYSNVGVFGGGKLDNGFATVVLNVPEVGLLVTGPIMDEPVVRDGQVVVRAMMKYGLTNDHRIIAAEDTMDFLAGFNGIMENPQLLMQS